MNRKLYVGNLPFSTEESMLEAMFAEAGPVQSVRVMRDRTTGQSRGFAFVEMATDDGARTAIERFNQADVQGRRLAVNEARPQTPGGGGGGRGFGGGGGGGFGGDRRGGGGGEYGGGGGGNRRREPRW